jgi:hypothetical protein
MPEAAVNEHCYLLFLKNKIRIAGQSSVPTPTADFILAQEPHECQFGNSVTTAPHRAHNFRAPLF